MFYHFITEYLIELCSVMTPSQYCHNFFFTRRELYLTHRPVTFITVISRQRKGILHVYILEIIYLNPKAGLLNCYDGYYLLEHKEIIDIKCFKAHRVV